MPNTRKKNITTIYKNDSELDSATESTGDFSDSGTDAQISEHSSSEDIEQYSSEEEFQEKSKNKNLKKIPRPNKKKKFAKDFISKISKQMTLNSEPNEDNIMLTPFSIKNLSETDKLLPPILNLSESDSSDGESPDIKSRKENAITTATIEHSDSENDDIQMEYQDVWSKNIQDNSEEIAKKTFLELEQHKAKIDATKCSIQNYFNKRENENDADVNDLLVQGEELLQENLVKGVPKMHKEDTDSEIEDWEEVKESKKIPQQGIQLIVEFPDTVCRKRKALDVEMMMKRKINRVKKEYQIYMHKVHVLCWLGYGNYISNVLNNQDVLSAALSLVPSKECYPGERVDVKYVEQITNWYKDKLTMKQDKNENKFKPNAPPLKKLLLDQIKSRVVTTKKYTVFIFVSMLRSLGLQCRIMLNFTTIPIKPPSSELCSLSTKPKNEKNNDEVKNSRSTKKNTTKKKEANKKVTSTHNKLETNLMQIDGNDDSFYDNIYLQNIMQVDGSNDDEITKPRRTTRSSKNKNIGDTILTEDCSPPKKFKRSPVTKSIKLSSNMCIDNKHEKSVSPQSNSRKNQNLEEPQKRSRCKKNVDPGIIKNEDSTSTVRNCNKKLNIVNKMNRTRNNSEKNNKQDNDSINARNKNVKRVSKDIENTKIEAGDNNIASNKLIESKQTVTNESEDVSSKYFSNKISKPSQKKRSLSRKRSQTAISDIVSQNVSNTREKIEIKPKSKTKTASAQEMEKSKYFSETNKKDNMKPSTSRQTRALKKSKEDDKERISHKDILTKKKNIKVKNDVTADLIHIVKNRVREAKEDSKKKIVNKVKNKEETDEDSDYLPEEKLMSRNSESDNEFKPKKISPKPKVSSKLKINSKIDRRVLSSDEESPQNRTDVWCEVYIEELEQWIAVDVIKAKVHCTSEIYKNATHPVTYVVGWDNNNYLKDLTRRYVPHWNTITRKQRVDPLWWQTSIQPWLGPKTAKDKEEDEELDRMQSEAPIPKSIAEYKNHPLYALKRHLLKFEAIYPPDAATLGFVRGEPVYARECVYVCRSRDTWLKEAKVVKLGEKPYKVVKARPKWDKLSNKLITDKPLEVFGPWQVQDYEPPVAENGIVPRNAYGNVELFKACMLPKGTVHIKLPGLNKVARKLNIDCAPAMTGFDFNGGWSHPVYDGFVVCKEYEEIMTQAWIKDQEEQERKEREKIDLRVYGNWRRLIKGLLIRERLKIKYGFEQPGPSQNKKKGKGPRLQIRKYH